MAKDPAFLFFPGDWLGGTMTFSRAHKGAYMDLLMCQFNNGHMGIEDVKVMLGEKDYESMWESKLKAKFKTDSEGKYYNQKLEDEKIKRQKFTDSRHKNLSGGDSHMQLDMDSQVNGHMGEHMENGNEDLNKNKKGVKKNGTKFSGNFKTQGQELYANRLAEGRKNDEV